MIDKQEISRIRKKTDDFLADLRSLTNSLEREKQKQIEYETYNINALEARAIIQTVAKNTQQLLEKQFNNLVTLCIQAVFQDEREFLIEFVEKRNKTEVECFIVKDGQKIGLFEGGGGLVDVAAIGCTVAFWCLEKRTRPIFILDEKFKFLHSPTLQKNLSDMLRLISKKMGLQFILITDQEHIVGDKEFGVIGGQVYNVTTTDIICPDCEIANLYSYMKNDKEIFRCKKCDYIGE